MKEITAKHLFGTKFSTLEMFGSQEEIEHTKKGVERRSRTRGGEIRFFEQDGLIFFALTDEHGNVFLNELKPYSILSSSNHWYVVLVEEDGRLAIVTEDLATREEMLVKRRTWAKKITDDRLKYDLPAPAAVAIFKR